MRTLLAAAALAALLLAVTAPPGEAAGSPSRDSVTGTARHLGADFPYPAIEVHFSAFVDATGLNPRGKLFDRTENLHSYEGKVTCLSVIGNQATVGIEIVKSTNPAFIGKGQLWSVVDGGKPGGVDRIAGYPLTSTPPVACPLLGFNVPVVSGNYVIHDRAP